MKNFSSISLFLPLGLFLGAVVLDMNILSGLVHEMQSQYTREGFVVFALILSLPIIYKQKWASDRNVLRGLRSLFFLIFFTYLILLLTNLQVFQVKEKIYAGVSPYEDASFYIFLLTWTFFASIFALVAMGTLRNLVFIKQKKYTARNFHLLMLLILFIALLGYKYIEDRGQLLKLGFSQGTFEDILLFVLVNLMVINAIRVSWLNYLNRKQKIACFWGGLILVPMQWHLFVLFHAGNPAVLFSPVLGKFIDLTILFISLYISFAFIALISHLPTAQLYDRKMRQISSLHNLSRAVSMEFDLKKLVMIIVRLALEVTEADLCWLELFDPKTRKLLMASSQNLGEQQRQDRDPESSDALTRLIMNDREVVMINHIAKSAHAESLTGWKANLQSLVAVPLVTMDKVLGILFVGKRIEYGFEQDDSDNLKAFGEQVVVAIENARLIEASLVKERLEQELRVAHEAQMKLLPKVMPRYDALELEAVCITANEVGGDYYDFFRLDENRLGVVVADVSGKGASAAFYMALLKGIMEALAKSSASPKQMLISANNTLYENIDRNTFVSAVYGIIDTRDMCFTFCRAGHCPVLFADRSAENIQSLEPYGMGLGLDRGDVFADTLEEVKLPLGAGTTILLFTDGVIEARNSQNQEFGESKLLQAFAQHMHGSVVEIKNNLVRDIKNFVGHSRSHDDLTLVVIKIK